MKLTYKDAGVDKEAGYKEVQLIKGIVKTTFNKGVVSDLGGFGGMFRIDKDKYENPILVSGTDGVGTKLDLAFRMDKHDTIGIDAVAMCVNDILCQGAKPLFFLDYIATGKLLPEKMAKIVEGVAEGCRQSQAALIGGETAEMPGIYQENHYDIAGFAVGIVDEKDAITGEKVEIGDKLIGLRSSGLHSNGFSLVRKIIFDLQNKDLNEYSNQLDSTIGEALLEPTKIYVQDVLPLIERFKIHGISHITGGGIYENLPRILKDGQRAIWDLKDYQIPPVFKLIQEWGNVETKEMFNTFNMGVGMVLVVDPGDYDDILDDLGQRKIDFVEMGHIIEGKKGVELCNIKE
ncbi:MAG: phosphoribosylformylglycinamidine cyclo-ligase [Tissierellia bacterium]|nr:phosphoribosylformylglycinamidine cyclo-ligase [Tissierellia bacterium]